MIYFSGNIIGMCNTERKMMTKNKKTFGEMFIIESLEMLSAVDLQC